MSNLTILNSSVRTLNNLYSLNDLHRLSGAEKKHQPSLFLRLETTKELLNEIEGTHDLQMCRSVKIIRGRSIQGTYACEELALAYATWISPKFHLVVLRAFIAMHKGEVQNTQPKLPLVEQPKPDVVIPHKDAVLIAKYLLRAKAFGRETETVHRQIYETLGLGRYIRNDLAAKAYDLAYEFNYFINPFIQKVMPETKF